MITLLDLFDVASKDCLSLIDLSKNEFSYGKSKKFSFSIRSIIDLIIRIFFLPLTSIPHIIFFIFPLFIYFDNLLLIYALLFIVVSICRIFIRSTNIYKKYEKKIIQKYKKIIRICRTWPTEKFNGIGLHAYNYSKFIDKPTKVFLKILIKKINLFYSVMYLLRKIKYKDLLLKKKIQIN